MSVSYCNCYSSCWSMIYCFACWCTKKWMVWFLCNEIWGWTQGFRLISDKNLIWHTGLVVSRCDGWRLSKCCDDTGVVYCLKHMIDARFRAHFQQTFDLIYQTGRDWIYCWRCSKYCVNACQLLVSYWKVFITSTIRVIGNKIPNSDLESETSRSFVEKSSKISQSSLNSSKHRRLYGFE